jgi:enediyne biosynthesis protein E8
VTGNGEPDTKTLTLEAFADTIIPGAKRFPGDRAVAGASDTPGAVEAGAIELLETPATGVTAGLEPLSQALNQHAANYAERTGLTLATDVPAFVALPFEHRTALVAELTTPGHPEKDGWVVLALFANMAYDTAAHLNTGAALDAGHPGLLSMGFARPNDDGLWRFPEFTYGRKLADIHPKTTESGSPE